MKKLFFFLLLSILLVFSCSREQDENFDSVKLNTYLLPLLDSQLDYVTSSDALTIANLYVNKFLKQPDTKGIEKLAFTDVVPIVDDDNQVRLYAVNMAGGLGYLLVSASKSYFPVLAIVYGSAFDADTPTTKCVLQEYMNDMSEMLTVGSDTLSTFKSLWKVYESESPNIITKVDGDLLSLTAESYALWRNNGYTFSSLSEGRPDGLPENIYQYYCSVAESIANPNYDYMQNSYILACNHHSGVGVYEPIIPSYWRTNDGFSSAMPLSDNNIRYQVSKAAVAIGQIMRYYRFPQSFLWDNMPLSSASSETAAFLRTLSDDMYTQYLDGNANVYINGVTSALDYYNYHYSVKNRSISNIYQSLSHGCPVLMCGSQTYYNPQYWICDGCYNYNSDNTYCLKVLSVVEPPLQFENAGEQYGPVSVIAYNQLHFNWCDGTHGWYITTVSQCTNAVKQIDNIYPY